MTSLAGRRVIVTGAAQGLGRAYAERLAREGARVAIADVDATAAEGTAGEIRASGGLAEVFVVDVARADQVQTMVRAVLDRFGGVDVLVNNAGGAFYPTTPFDEFPEEQWDHVVAVNLKGQWLCARAVAPHIKALGRGKIINITSTTVHRGYPDGLAPYTAAKASVIGLTRAMAHELGRYNVTVNAVAPGYTPVATPKQVHRGGAAEALRQQMIAEQCLKRSETPDDLADVIAFLASDGSDFITGQVLNVDGGWAMG